MAPRAAARAAAFSTHFHDLEMTRPTRPGRRIPSTAAEAHHRDAEPVAAGDSSGTADPHPLPWSLQPTHFVHNQHVRRLVCIAGQAGIRPGEGVGVGTPQARGMQSATEPTAGPPPPGFSHCEAPGYRNQESEDVPRPAIRPNRCRSPDAIRTVASGVRQAQQSTDGQAA